MCYRVATPTLADINYEFNCHYPEDADLYEQYHHLSGFSSLKAPVLTVEDPKTLKLIDWKSALDKFDTLNSKCEEIFITKKFSFKARLNRAILPVTGFFESHEVKKFNKKTGEPLKTGDKYPYFISLENKKCFGLACLITPMNTVTILTTEANEMMKTIHNLKERMPVILHSEDYAKWLSPDLLEDEQKNIMRPYESEAMNAYTISKLLYSRNENNNVPDVYKKHIYEGVKIAQFVKGQPIFEEGQLSLL